MSTSGCKFRLTVDVEKEAVLAIRVVSRDKSRDADSRPVLFQIMRIEQLPDGWMMGASKSQPEGLWCVSFPAPPEPGTLPH
ncbi:MAG: hypothetical protein WBP79_02505 [Candidatus Acidiferrales bacterium]